MQINTESRCESMKAELMEKAMELERKLLAMDRAVEGLPPHAPLRLINAARYAEVMKEYQLVMDDLFEAVGQIPLFPEGTD